MNNTASSLLSSSPSAVTPLQRELIEFLLSAGVLTFGEFTLKSGRKAPYFINMGNVNDGQKINRLGAIYARHILSVMPEPPTNLFGPAYKGIPLAVATASALAMQGCNVAFSFNRKEEKTHGDRGVIVGHKPGDGDRLVIVEDVITAGTTLREIVPFVRALGKLTLLGVVVAVDRCERGEGDCSALQEAQRELGVTVYPVVNIHQIVAYLCSKEASQPLSAEMRMKIDQYLENYGARR